MFGNCSFATSCRPINQPVIDSCIEVVLKWLLSVWYDSSLILQEVHWGGELFEVKCVLRVTEVNESGEFSVCTLKVENFMNVEREVENESSFNVKVSIQNLIE